MASWVRSINMRGGSINGLGDVTVSSAANNQILQYNSSTLKWENKTNVVLPGTLQTTGALTVASGGATVTAGGLTITDGGLDLTTENITLVDTTTATTGVIMKGAVAWAHNFSHSTGDTAVPIGQNTCIGGAGNLTMGSTATQTYHGSYNTFVGYTAGVANSTGFYNSYFGLSSGYSNSTGNSNSFFGYAAGYSNSTGANNSSFGRAAGYSISTGASNSFFGLDSGRYLADGSSPNQTTGTSCYIGAATKASADGVANENVFGYNAIGAGSNSCAYGDANVTNHKFNAGNITLVDTTTATTGVIMKGAVAWAHNFKHPTGDTAVPVGQNTCIGGAGNLTMGSTATQTYHASYNTFAGYTAGYSNSTGYYNAFFGLSAGYSNSSGHSNSFFGHTAGFSNTSGHSNSFFGLNSGYSNSSGGGNSFFGRNSGYSISTGSNNSFFGLEAGRYLANGSSPNQTTGTSCYIGASTKASADGVSNENVFGYNATGAGSNTCAYGDTNVTNHKFNAGTITTLGGRIRNVTDVNAATYDLLVTDDILSVSYTGTGAVTSLTLPTAQCVEGRTIVIKDQGLNCNTNNITVDTEGAETIDGSATDVMATDGQSITLYSDGSNWFKI